MHRSVPIVASASLILLAGLSLGARQDAQSPPDQDGFKFRSGVELINVTATVSDAQGRFVPDLRREDFVVYEDEVAQAIAHFSAERVPVSLGIVLDTSGSMAGEKMDAARRALYQFVYDLLDDRDEIFLYRFSDVPMLVQGWTTSRPALSQALGRITPNGGTAMYDAVVEAIPLASAGMHQKKAIVVISDGNDTASRSGVHQIRQLVRQTEVLLYAIGIDGTSTPTLQRTPQRFPPRMPPGPVPFPIPGGRGRPPGRFPPGLRPWQPQIGGPGSPWQRSAPRDERVNSGALRDMTDDSGGRTEIVREARDLAPATASIADELSKQYHLGYQTSGKKDGRWHSIRVEVPNKNYRVRARTGYVAN